MVVMRMMDGDDGDAVRHEGGRWAAGVGMGMGWG